jgi:hypothetical protein
MPRRPPEKFVIHLHWDKVNIAPPLYFEGTLTECRKLCTRMRNLLRDAQRWDGKVGWEYLHEPEWIIDHLESEAAQVAAALREAQVDGPKDTPPVQRTRRSNPYAKPYKVENEPPAVMD